MAINVATDAAGDPLAWVVVVLLTVLGVAITLRMQQQPHARPAEQGAATPPRSERSERPERARREPSVHNTISGTVHGGVVQAGNLGSVTVNSPTTINQNAVARDGGTVYQAGRDVNPNP
ncbi:hypothetical protein ACRAKJ_34890 [Saccharothrix sp. DSM 118769]